MAHRYRRASFARPAIASCLLAMSGCTTTNLADYARLPSTTLVGGESSVLSQTFGPALAAHPDKSGFILLDGPQSAFEARAALVLRAQRSLDMQYYIWDMDRSGTLMAGLALAAADHGVRVRILLDDFTTSGNDLGIAALNSHPNIEVRLFNPYGSRGGRGLQMLGDFDRLNHRMHNKSIVADGHAAIVGGRNIGDHYYGLSGTANFRDLDTLAVGPVAAEVGASFDTFWNSEWAVPVEALKLESAEKAAARLEKGRAGIPEWRAQNADVVAALMPPDRDLDKDLVAWRDAMVWAPAHVVVDDPAKAGGDGTPHVAMVLNEHAQRLTHELLIESAYFVPGERTIESFGALVERGVHVQVLTNSLASTDVMAVHAVYAPKRPALIEKGVELYEYRVDSRHDALLGSSGASLHSKVVVFDRASVFIGSFNLDGRSALQNTELGLMIESNELATQVADFIEKGCAPSLSWHVVTDPKSKDIRWQSANGQAETEMDHEPGASIWRRMGARMLRWLPEKQL